jgi:hypothetical protein
MNKLALIAVAFSFAACAPKATKEECQATCGKLAALEMAGVVKADVMRPAQEAAQAKAAAVQKEKADAVAALEAEYAKKKGAKPKLAKELAAKKEALNKQFAEKEAAIAKETGDALRIAGEAQAKEAAATAEKVKKTTEACAAGCVGKWSKAMVECQAKTTKVDEFNACK